MAKTIQGDLQAGDARFAIVVSRFNKLVTGKLLDGALGALRDHGADEERLSVVRVPGAFEIPIVADRLARSGKYDAVICLGAVIQGETMHHEYINQQTSAGIMQAARETGVPVTFGVLTCQTTEQALARAGGKVGNKGAEAALAAIELVNVLRQLGGE